MAAEIVIIPCLKDNYAYLVKTKTACAVVDPSEAPPVEAALTARGWRLTHILNTHHHGDHTGGNLALKQRFGAKVVGPGKDAARIPGIDVGVYEASGWRLDDLPVEVLEVPGHTSGAITFLAAGNAFTGDTLFSLGCGRLFEGDPATMHASLQKLARLPDDTKIYCGHEYTLNNGRFALTLEPDNAALRARVDQAAKAREAGSPTLPSTMGLEKQTNPFLRTDSPAIRKALEMEKENAISVFAEIRRRKDVF